MASFPTEKQAAFLLMEHEEAFYGGAGGGGKSIALLMGALQYATVPGYAALLLRRTFTDLALPGALMDVADHWLRPTDARPISRGHGWRIPGGGSITFGFLENEKDKYRYQSAAFQYIGFDELTQFTESQYTYLFSRLRRLQGFPVPLRMRSASNPGNSGHQWVKQRFLVEGRQYNRPFLPARIVDNPHLDVLAYRRSLAHMDPVTRLQIEEGNWDVSAEGELFKRHWFKAATDWPRSARLLRFWDLAGTEAMHGTDPDYTAGCLLAYALGQYWVLDMRHERLSPKGVEDLIATTAARDGKAVAVWIEQEPGSSGKAVVDHYQRQVLPGYKVYGLRPSGSKVERARPVSSAAEAGNVHLLTAPWNGALLDELALFPAGAHDDQVDALSGALSVISTREGRVAFV